MENTVKLLIEHFIDDYIEPSRQVTFVIPESALADYLKESGDGRTVESFMSGYTSKEADVIYGYAADDGMILDSKITYSDDFLDSYYGYLYNARMLYPKASFSKEHYYWTVYVKENKK